MPVVSILTTVFNREKFLEECLESVLASSFIDWELIIVDDCSEDGSVAIAKEYEKKDSRIKVIVNNHNLGDYKNRNKAATFANGKYLKYLDADDIIYPHSLQIMVDAMEKFQEAGLGLSFNVIDDNSPYPHLVDGKTALLSFFKGPNILSVGPSAAIIRRSIFEELRGFSGIQYIGDSELWCEIAKRSPVVKLQPSLVYWRMHQGQQIVSERKNYDILRQRFLFKIRLLEEIKVLYPSDYIHPLVDFTKFRFARSIWNLAIKQMKFRWGLKLLKNSGISIADMIRSLFPYGKS